MSRHTTNGSAELPLAECTAEEALEELKRRGREMSEAERELYIRRAVQMVNPTALADRLLASVPSLTDPTAEDGVDTPTEDASDRPPRPSAELLEDLTLPEVDDE